MAKLGEKGCLTWPQDQKDEAWRWTEKGDGHSAIGNETQRLGGFPQEWWWLTEQNYLWHPLTFSCRSCNEIFRNDGYARAAPSFQAPILGTRPVEQIPAEVHRPPPMRVPLPPRVKQSPAKGQSQPKEELFESLPIEAHWFNFLKGFSFCVAANSTSSLSQDRHSRGLGKGGRYWKDRVVLLGSSVAWFDRFFVSPQEKMPKQASFGGARKRYRSYSYLYDFVCLIG